VSAKVEQRRTGLAVAVAAALMALLASCNWDFLNGDGTDGEPAYHYETIKDDQGRVVTMKCYNADDVLQWYESYGYDDDDNRTKTQRYSADNVLQYTYLYDWQDGKITIEAYFDGDNTLRWYDHSTYDGEQLVELCEYDGDDALQWFEVYEYSATGKQTLAERFDGSSPPALVGASTFEYDAEDLLVLEKSYDENGDLCAKTTHEWNAEGKEARSVTYRAPDSSASLAPPSARLGGAVTGRAAGAEPPLPVPEEPPPDAPSVTLTEQDLEVAARSFWFYDAYGTTQVTTTPEYLPTAIARQDTRLEEDVSVALGYDEADRITSKTTSYGDTEALKIVLTYERASGYTVSRIQSSGAAMLVPLNFDLSYDDGLPTEVVIGYDTSTLFTLTYTYEADNPLKHTITVKDGDGNLYGCYVFTLAEDYLSARIDVYTDEARKHPNGYYKLAYDEGSRTVSFTSYNASGKPVQRYSYGYEDLEGLGGQAMMVAESKFGFQLGDDQSYDAVIKEIEAGDFDFATLLRIRSAEDVAELFL
jgi:hypothetical protein